MARRKITDTGDIEAKDLPELTEQEIEFATLLLKRVNATDAYIQAFNAQHWKRTSAQVAASRLANREDIRLWLSYARLALLSEGVVTLDEHLRELDRLKELAIQSGNIGAAVDTEKWRGKVSGLAVDRVEDVTQRATDTDLIATLRSMLGDEVADALAEKMGATEH